MGVNYELTLSPHEHPVADGGTSCPASAAWVFGKPAAQKRPSEPADDEFAGLLRSRPKVPGLPSIIGLHHSPSIPTPLLCRSMVQCTVQTVASNNQTSIMPDIGVQLCYLDIIWITDQATH